MHIIIDQTLVSYIVSYIINVPMVKVPSTAMANIDVVPIAVKQNSIDVACASDGIKTITVSESKLLLLFIWIASLSKRQA